MPCALPQQQREGDDRSHPPAQSHSQFPLPLSPKQEEQTELVLAAEAAAPNAP